MVKSISTRRSFVSKKLIAIVLGVAVLAGLAAFGGYYFKKYNDLKNSTPDKIQQAKTEQIVSDVAKLYALPKNEKPTIATVSDEQGKRDALKKEYPFFDQANGGDIALIYTEAKLAILYRPSTKQIIKVAPVNVESGKVIRVLGKEADRAAVEKLLNDNKLTFTKADPKTSVQGIVVVDIKGTSSEEAKKLAEIVKGTVGTLPEGEDKPGDVDLLIIVGPTN